MSTTTRKRSTPTTRYFDEQWETTYADAEITVPGYGSGTGAEWLEQLRTGPADEQNELLRVMLRLAVDGDDHATHTIVRLMTPTIVTFSRTIRSTYNPADRVALAMSTAWVAIRGFEFNRVEKFRATLSMRIFRQLVQDDARDELPVTDDMLNELVEPVEDPTEAYVGVLTWALDMRILDRDEVALFARVVLGERKRKEIAEDMGITYENLAKRYARIRSKLAIGMREHIAQFGSWN